MRTLSIAIVFAATTSIASFAQAAPQTAVETAPSASAVQGKPLARSWMSVDQFKPYAGVYAMANGKTLRITHQQNRFYAQFDNEPAVRIYAVGAKDFVAQHGDLNLKFDQNDGHDHEDVVVFTPSTGVSVASR